VGVALSLVPLTLVLFVADGMIEGITARYLETSTYHLQAVPAWSLSPGELAKAAAKVARIPGVKAVWPELQGPGIVVAASTEGERQPQPSGALIRAVDPAFLADPGLRRYLTPKEGTLAFARANDVLLGEAMASKLGVRSGDYISVMTARENDKAFSPRLTTLRVRAVVSTGYEELDSLWALVPLETGSRMLAPGTRRIFLGIKTDRPFGDLEGVRASVAAVLGSGSDGGPPWACSPWQEIERNLWKSFATTRALLVLVMALAVAVAAVNVGASLAMMALERKKDIAILKSTGVSSRQISAIFIKAGAITGALGTSLGLLVGSLLSCFVNQAIAGIEYIATAATRLWSLLIGAPLPPPVRLLNPSYYLERIPISFSPLELVLIAAGSMLLCVLSSLYPARRAARLPPMEIFRKT
jgi:lipoprotein-releasing system permease protein